ncbi:HalX domain-containing protein [Natronomonas gomsonensis]|uniref:HalX domain-containing protein n=1 Tax=Natronomonas gomsonensis TaxID=1046043 RepID=UPI0020CA8F95|nr:HalX domain-containing protein [Natronomonas gomsonensis]MCY4729736.1 HalX domain-containing protein [Natronomonas gomsonensis]
MGTDTETTETATVLVVDDERDLADLYTAWLSQEYDVRTAYGGQEALDALDEDVDVALIDRLMPQVSGDEVLEHIRESEYDCRVSMVTAVEPDFDIIEMGFDEYIVKPIRRDDLVGVVESLLSRSAYDNQLQEFFSLASKRAALQSQKSQHELENSDAYSDLTERVEALRADLDSTAEELSTRDFEVQLRKLNADRSA